MTSSTLSLLCAGLLLILAILFSLESRRGLRYFEPVRRLIDKLALFVWQTEARVAYAVSHGRIRIFFHYLLHRLLATCTAILAKLEEVLVGLQRRNRSVARSLTKGQKKNHLSKIKDHQKATALSTEEKQDLRERKLAGE